MVRATCRFWCSLAGAAMLTLPARADWVVRPIADGSARPPANVDVMISPDGQAVVGFTLDDERVWISRMDVTGRVTHAAGSGSAMAAAFAMDPFGGVYFAARNSISGAVHVGVDVGDWGGIIDGQVAQDRFWGLPGIVLDRQRIPVVASVDSRGQPYMARFDPVTASWAIEPTIDDGLLGSSGGPQALAYDGRGELFLAGISEGQTVNPLLIASRAAAGIWMPLSPENVDASGGVAMAGAAQGVGFAYVTTKGLRYGVSDGLTLSTEPTGGTELAKLSPHSLAFDPAGNPAIAYVADVSDGPGQLHLLRRDTAGQWTDEQLPLEAWRATLAFDAAGEPLIAAATAGGVALIGRGLAPVRQGDLVGPAFPLPDGVIDGRDIDAIIARAGSADSVTDFNGDGIVTPADADCLITAILGLRIGDANLDGRIDGDDYFSIDSGCLAGARGYGQGDFDHDGLISGSDYLIIDRAFLEPSASPVMGVPEPASGCVILVMAAALLARRRVWTG